MVDVDGETRDQPAGWIIVEKAQIHPRQVGKEPVLVVGYDAQPDETHQHRLGIIGEAFDQESREYDAAEGPQYGPVLSNKHFVDDGLHQPRAKSGGARH